MKLHELFNRVPESECILTEDELWEMARVQKADSGIACIMWVSTKDYVNGSHGPRLKVSNIPDKFSRDDNFVVTISKQPIVVAGRPKYTQLKVEDIKDWIILNYNALIKYWNDEYEGDSDFYRELKKV